MTLYRPHGIACTALCLIVGLLSSATAARAQGDAGAPSQADALAAAAKANPNLVKDMAKELGSTPEQAAGAAGVIFVIAKSFLKPEDFAKVAKAVPGMDAFLATVPTAAAGANDQAGRPGLTLTTGFASSSPLTASSTSAATTAAPDAMTSALSAFPKLGIPPDMLAKAIPFLTGYLKKHGGGVVSDLLGSVFKAGK